MNKIKTLHFCFSFILVWFGLNYFFLEDTLCSMDKEKRREMYRVDFIPLEKIPVWSPSGEQNTHHVLYNNYSKSESLCFDLSTVWSVCSPESVWRYEYIVLLDVDHTGVVLCKTVYMWTSLCLFLGGSSCKPQYQVNEELNKKISLCSGDITKLEIDSIANAGESRSTGKIIVYIYLLVFVWQNCVCLAVHYKLKTDSAVYC